MWLILQLPCPQSSITSTRGAVVPAASRGCGRGFAGWSRRSCCASSLLEWSTWPSSSSRPGQASTAATMRAATTGTATTGAATTGAATTAPGQAARGVVRIARVAPIQAPPRQRQSHFRAHPRPTTGFSASAPSASTRSGIARGPSALQRPERRSHRGRRSAGLAHSFAERTGRGSYAPWPRGGVSCS